MNNSEIKQVLSNMINQSELKIHELQEEQENLYSGIINRKGDIPKKSIERITQLQDEINVHHGIIARVKVNLKVLHLMREPMNTRQDYLQGRVNEIVQAMGENEFTPELTESLKKFMQGLQTQTNWSIRPEKPKVKVLPWD